jgi:hypothetical protein
MQTHQEAIAFVWDLPKQSAGPAKHLSNFVIQRLANECQFVFVDRIKGRSENYVYPQ